MSAGQIGDCVVAAQWVMRGTNRRPVLGLPPTGAYIELPGTDFICVCDGAIRSLESMIGLSYLADHTQRVRFGTVVALIFAHDPVLLARQAAALDDLSAGRMVLGLGAGGGQDSEHSMFGYTMGDIPTRMARLEEGLEVITRLLRSAEPVSFTGRFYRLEEAMLLPRPGRQGGPPILIGGSGPKRTLPLVARYGDNWNPKLLTPEAYRERAALLDDLLRAEGRQPRDVRRTMNVRVLCGRSPAELERGLS
jgi:alkanesulfonate monooxygenase SsuD/methylene tetrahydromethanopterin reductase-like flavin-dependent oxidoreductase (luciferase family)